MSFQTALTEAADQTQTVLKRAMHGWGDLPVVEGMRYAVAGGKGLRGFLVMEAARVCAAPVDGSVAGAAIEAIHAYSLVHDDMPCMDDDLLRRGQPTVHAKWDEATAVLVGDGLQTLGFQLLASHACHPDADTRLALIASLATAAGAQGMVLGQAQDIAAETATTPLTLDEIITLQANKTGALIEWSAVAGARLAGADVAPMQSYARALGLAFQIADDILDVEGDAKAVGKAVGKDADAGKATFVSLLGLDTSKARARHLVAEACDALAVYGTKADTLRDAATFVVTRAK